MGKVTYFMKNLRYPEFNSFSVSLNRSVVRDEEPVSGVVKIIIADNVENCVQDVIVECNIVAQIVNIRDKDSIIETGKKHTIWQAIQRNGAAFESGGIPGGKYDIPFLFRLPKGCPPSFEYQARDFEGKLMYFKIQYNITAIILNALDSGLERKWLRKIAKFDRYVSIKPTDGVFPSALERKVFMLGRTKPLLCKITLEKDTFEMSENIRMVLDIDNQSRRGVKGFEISLMQNLEMESPDKGKCFCIEDERASEQRASVANGEGEEGEGVTQATADADEDSPDYNNLYIDTSIRRELASERAQSDNVQGEQTCLKCGNIRKPVVKSWELSKALVPIAVASGTKKEGIHMGLRLDRKTCVEKGARRRRNKVTGEYPDCFVPSSCSFDCSFFKMAVCYYVKVRVLVRLGLDFDIVVPVNLSDNKKCLPPVVEAVRQGTILSLDSMESESSGSDDLETDVLLASNDEVFEAVDAAYFGCEDIPQLKDGPVDFSTKEPYLATTKQKMSDDGKSFCFPPSYHEVMKQPSAYVEVKPLC
eukprot:Nk52_evm19s2496 gene=Nk52_evmTU19s2496